MKWCFSEMYDTASCQEIERGVFLIEMTEDRSAGLLNREISYLTSRFLGFLEFYRCTMLIVPKVCEISLV